MVKVIRPKQSARKVKVRSFGPVSTINTAPVAIGNSITGSKAKVTNLTNGVKVTGRDFAFDLTGTSSGITDWQLVGGMPITPCVMPSTVLRNYAQMYGKFKVNSVVFHYITSSPTSQAGDVMFHHERDRKSPRPDFTNASFLPYVLSDEDTVIGPQWTNHSMTVRPVSAWKTTNFAYNADLNEDCVGSIMFFSKTNATSSPGYILMDYDISFAELSINPRAGLLPVARGKMSFCSFGLTATAVTLGSTLVTGVGVLGDSLTDAVSAAMPTGYTTGDVYKFTVCATASLANNTWTNVDLTNLFIYGDATDVAVTISDGFTGYCAWIDTTIGGGDVGKMSFHPTLEGALTGTKPFSYGVTATITYGLIVSLELVGSRAGALVQSSY